MAAGLSAGTAYLDIAPRLAKDFGAQLGRSVDDPIKDSSEKVGGSLSGLAGKVAGLAAGAFAAKEVFGFAKGAYDAAAESNKIAAQTEAAIKSTGGAAKISADQIGNLADSISKKTGVDDEAVQSGENLLLTFTNIKNEAGKGNDVFNQATSTLVDMAAALGGDASSSAIQLGKALNDPVAGISALSRVGVTFTEDQKKVIKSLVDTGDTAGAQKVILAELGKEFGGSAAAQATSADKLKVTFGNLQEDIGKKLIPVVESLSTWFAANLPAAMAAVGGALATLKPFIDLVMTGFRAFFAAVKEGDVTSDGFVGVMETVGDAIHRLAPIIRDLVVQGIEFLGHAWSTWGPTIVTVVQTVIDIAGVLLATTITVVSGIIEHWDTIKPVVEVIVGLIAVGLIPQLLLAAATAVFWAAANAAAWVSTQVAAVASTVITVAQMAIQGAQWIWMGAVAVANAAVIAAAWLISLGPIALVVAAVVAAVALIVMNWDWIKDAAAKVWNWITENWPTLLAVLTGPFGLAVLAIVRNWDTIKDAVVGVKNWIVDRWNDVVGFITGIPGRITDAASGMWDGIKNAFKSALNWVIEKWNSLKFEIPGFKVGPVGFDGFTLGVPSIPKFHQGGIVPGGPGDEILAILAGGERVVRAGEGGDGAGAGGRNGGGPAAPIIGGDLVLNAARMEASDVAGELYWLKISRGY